MFHDCDKTTEFMMAGKCGRCNGKEYGGRRERQGSTLDNVFFTNYQLGDPCAILIRKQHSQLAILYDLTQISIVHLFPLRI